MPLINYFPSGGGGGVNDTLPKQVPENEFTATVRTDLAIGKLQFRVACHSGWLGGTSDYCVSTVIQVVDSTNKTSSKMVSNEYPNNAINPRVPLPNPPASITVPSTIHNGETLIVTWEPSTTSEVSYILEMKIDDEDFIEVPDYGIYDCSYQIENFRSYPAPTVQLQWTKTDEYWAGAKIIKKLGSAPQGFRDGTVIYDGNDIECFDENIDYGDNCFYRLYPYNSRGQLQTEMRVVREEVLETLNASALPVGTKFKANYDGILTNFIITNQGIPNMNNSTAPYDETANGVWCMIEPALEYACQFRSSNSSYPDYTASIVKSYIEETAFGKLDPIIKNSLVTVNLPMARNYNLISNIATKIFAPAAGELGKDEVAFGAVHDGNVWSQYEACGTGSNPLRIAYTMSGNTAVHYWTRSGGSSAKTRAYSVTNSGSTAQDDPTATRNIRFAFVLPNDFKFRSTPDENGIYTPLGV